MGCSSPIRAFHEDQPQSPEGCLSLLGYTPENEDTVCPLPVCLFCFVFCVLTDGSLFSFASFNFSRFLPFVKVE